MKSDFLNKKQILVISPFTAYKNIKHAGGKVHYYYLSKIENNSNITLISIANEIEKDDIQNNIINTKQKFIFFKSNKITLKVKFQRFIWERNPFDKYAGFIDYNSQSFFLHTINLLYKSNYKPEIILLDWTQAVFLSNKLRKLFPNSKIVCIEQDVTYLKYLRFYENSKNIIKRIINYKKFNNIKRQELKSLSYANQIITLNQKDTDLLELELKYKIPIKTIVPYFDKYINITRKNINSNIIYFGAMSRPENYNSAIWFIKNILPSLPEHFKFIIIGNNPAKELFEFQNQRIIITGFVKDISPYLETSLCFAAPIVMGAGIKIKILEAMSAGIPVLTNDIGIEGIPAEQNKDYLHCTSKEEYINQILELYNNIDKNIVIGKNARDFILKKFDYDNCSYI